MAIAYTNRQNSARGGIGIYVRDMYHVKQRDYIECHYEGEFGSLFLEISYNNVSTIVGGITMV